MPRMMTSASPSPAGSQLFSRVLVLLLAANIRFVDFSFCAAPERDHSPDAGKMVVAPMPSLLARGFCLRNDAEEVVPFGVTKERQQVASEPEFISVIVHLAGRLKGRDQALNRFVRSVQRRHSPNLFRIGLRKA